MSATGMRLRWISASSARLATTSSSALMATILSCHMSSQRVLLHSGRHSSSWQGTAAAGDSERGFIPSAPAGSPAAGALLRPLRHPCCGRHVVARGAALSRGAGLPAAGGRRGGAPLLQAARGGGAARGVLHVEPRLGRCSAGVPGVGSTGANVAR